MKNLYISFIGKNKNMNFIYIKIKHSNIKIL